MNLMGPFQLEIFYDSKNTDYEEIILQIRPLFPYFTNLQKKWDLDIQEYFMQLFSRSFQILCSSICVTLREVSEGTHSSTH